MAEDTAEKAAETVDETKAQIAETLAPGSVTRDDEPSEQHSSNGVSADDVRSIVREEIDKAMADLKTVVPETPAEEPESFQQPVRVPWTHRGSRH